MDAYYYYFYYYYYIKGTFKEFHKLLQALSDLDSRKDLKY